MTNKNKIKGSNFEREVVELLGKKIKNSSWRKMPTSGAMGTILNEPLLTGDVSGNVEGIRRRFKIECKAGYNSSTDKAVKQLTLKKEWLDKIASEAKEILAIPMVMGKFSGARSGTQVFVVLDVDTFAYLINELADSKREDANEES